MKFHIGDVLSITDGRLVSVDGVGGIYKILNFMTGDNLFTHQLPRASETCRPALLEQHPQLFSDDLKEKLDKMCKLAAHMARTDKAHAKDTVPKMLTGFYATHIIPKYGEYIDVEPLSEGEYEHQNPMAEFVEKMG